MNMLHHHSRNLAGKDYAVGDIHGAFAKLRGALAAINFDPLSDRLFSVGDLVDRGPDSDEVLDWLAKPWFIPVRGNHEQMAIDFARGGLDAHLYNTNGGGWNISNPPHVRTQYADAFDALPFAIEVETAQGLVGIVHAECVLSDWADMQGALADPNGESFRDATIWSRDRWTNDRHDSIEGVRAVVVGHTPLVRYSSLGNTIYIDTGAWIARENRQFTILDLATLRPVHQRTIVLWDEI
jgi:serine/threonine protein phosphatase 1